MTHFKPEISRRTVLRSSAATLATVSLGGWAQSAWPTKPVTLVVPFPAGGGTDAFARPLSAQFAKLTGRQMVIDNRGGAGGTLGAGVAAKAAPDGYTLFMGAVHHAIAPSMYPKLDYDIEKDFVPLVLVANVPQVLVVNPKNHPGDFKEFIERVRKAPGRFNYGSAGAGTSHHLAGELFKQQTETDLMHVPYKGTGPALNDVLGGTVPVMFSNLPATLAHIRSGKLIALGLTDTSRTPVAPDIPTLAEQGIAGVVVTSWYGLLAPAGTPPALVEQLARDAAEILAHSAVREQLRGQGLTEATQKPAQFAAHIQQETQTWARIIRARGISAQ
jgi:tripartite-type tricarboxylate transporter receptor subunit TctC